MRVALVGPTYPFRGGIAHYTTILHQALCEQGHPVFFVSFKRQYPRWLFPGQSDRDPSAAPIRASDVAYLLDPFNPLSWWAAARAIRHYRPQLVVFSWWVPFWAPVFWTVIRLLRRVDARILFLCHNVLPHEGSWWANGLSRLTLRQGDGFIVHSALEEEQLRSFLPQAQVRQNPHPTYAVFAETAAPASRDGVRARLGLTGDTLLFFGFVREYKGLRYLFQALPRVLERHPVTLLVVGEFWGDVQEYRQLADRLGIADHLRIVDRYVPNEEVADYFIAADLVVLPYVSATGSGVAQIALGLGRPILVTDVPGLAELVQDGVNGLLVPPADAARLAEGIVRFFCDGERERIRVDRGHEALFSWRRMVETIESFVK